MEAMATHDRHTKLYRVVKENKLAVAQALTNAPSSVFTEEDVQVSVKRYGVLLVIKSVEHGLVQPSPGNHLMPRRPARKMEQRAQPKNGSFTFTMGSSAFAMPPLSPAPETEWCMATGMLSPEELHRLEMNAATANNGLVCWQSYDPLFPSYPGYIRRTEVFFLHIAATLEQALDIARSAAKWVSHTLMPQPGKGQRRLMAPELGPYSYELDDLLKGYTRVINGLHRDTEPLGRMSMTTVAISPKKISCPDDIKLLWSLDGSQFQRCQ